MNATATERPTCQPPIIDNIPQEMKNAVRWVVWRYDLEKSGWTKVPYRVDGRGRASSTDPVTWGTFDQALQAFDAGDYAGIGFALGDGWAGIDFDDNLDDEGRYVWGAEIIAAFDSYKEVSPSGTGIKIFIRGVKPAGSKCSKRGFGPDGIGKLEVYDNARWFAVTGDAL